MGAAASRRKNLSNDAICSVAAKVRAAQAFGDFLSHSHSENPNGSAHLLCETLVVPDPESLTDPVGSKNNNHLLRRCSSVKGHEGRLEPGLVKPPPGSLQSPPPSVTISVKPPQLALEHSFSLEEDQQKRLECPLQPARVYTISTTSTQHGMLTGSSRGSKESLELDILKEKSSGVASRVSSIQPSTSPSSASSSPTQHHRSGGGRGTPGCSHHHHHANHHHHVITNVPSSNSGSSNQQQSPSQQSPPQQSGAGPHSHHASHHHPHPHHHHHHLSHPPLQTSISAHNIRSWGEGGKGEAECGGLVCETCTGAPSRSQGSLDLESATRDAGKQHRRLERMWSVDRMTGLDREETNWFPKENMFTFQTATTTMQANFRKHLRMVGSRRIKAQTFAERRSTSFSRSWSDPTPVRAESGAEAGDSGDMQTSSGTADDGVPDVSVDWEEEKEMERQACEGDDFRPPKIMLISSKVPKAEYVPTIIRRDDPSIIPILYDHEHATFDDILEEIDKKLTAYRRGSKFWRMLIFCQGGPGHLYLLKNKVATFAKVEKEEDMSQFWRRLSRFMSKVNPEPNLIHIMGCYVLGNPNGEKLFQKLKNLMRPYSVDFQSPLELSAQGKEMIEMYFDFRLYRLWKTRQHSKLLDYEDFL
ncbi:NMDA receptor synaptonuclear signaling and neuronal migration factor [Pholidichthys leucotaenia]